MSDLLTKYRPTSFKGVVGQPSAVKSIRAAIKGKTGSSFLLTGPSGVGKTTIARIIANQFGCEGLNIIEIDAATHTGVDAMREIASVTKFKAFGKSPNRTIIIDECHQLSKPAWNSLLKNLEEPPEHIFWVLCTTEPAKVPNTIKTRCLSYDLKSVISDDIDDFLMGIAEKEGFDTDVEENDKIIGLLVKESNGSPRQALALFAQCKFCKTRAEAASLISTAEDREESIQLCRLLMKGDKSWKSYTKIIKDLDGTNPESIRLMVLSYFSKVLLNSDSGKALQCLQVMEAFKEPYNQSEKLAPLFLSIGEVVFDEE